MHQQTAAVNVAKEIMSQSGAFRSAFNNTGDICHDKGYAFIHIDHTQVGKQGGKMIVGDFGPGVGGNTQQSGFAHVGEAHQAHICQQLQLQNDIPLLALQSGLGKPGNLTSGRGIVGIAPAAAAAPGNDEIFACGHVHNNLVGFGIPNHRASGNLDDEIFSPLAGHLPAQTVDTGLSGILALIPEIQQS